MGSQDHGSAAPSRRAFLGGAAVLSATAALPVWPAARSAQGHFGRDGFRVSLSVSPFTEAVLGAVTLADGRRRASTVREVQRLVNRHGATEVFVRVATLRNARDGDAEYGFERAIERARLAAHLGMPLNPELGLWAVYGDITRQPPPDFGDYPSIVLPGPWLSLTLAQMEDALRQYGALVARQILSPGVQVNYWDLGNEVEWGVAGVAIRSFNQAGYSPPTAIDPAIGQMSAVQLLAMPEADRIAWLQQHLWPYVGRLLAAVAQGVRSADPAARFSTHLASIGVQDATLHTAFWETMSQAGYRPGQFGTSLYPTNGDPATAKRSSSASPRHSSAASGEDCSSPSSATLPARWGHGSRGTTPSPANRKRPTGNTATYAIWPPSRPLPGRSLASGPGHRTTAPTRPASGSP